MLEELEQDLPTILIVDDERVNRTMLAELLGQQYRVLLAKDGPGALATANREAHRLMLILLDVSMPGMLTSSRMSISLWASRLAMVNAPGPSLASSTRYCWPSNSASMVRLTRSSSTMRMVG